MGHPWTTERRLDPQAWLADVLACIAAHPAHRLDELLPGIGRRCRLQSPPERLDHAHQ
jgi:hypothetical protein